MPTIKRNSHAATAARSFIESLFSEPGVELASSDIGKRAMQAGINAGVSTITQAAQVLVKEGFLEQPNRGWYRRPDSKGTPLDLPAPVALSPEASETLHTVAIMSRLSSVEAILGDLVRLLGKQDATLAEIRTAVAPLVVLSTPGE